MKTRIKKLIKKPFVQNIIIMGTGTAAAQAISLFLSPIITRLYGPEAYGLMGTFIAIIAIITPVAALTFPIAIVLPKNDLEAKGLVKLSLSISLILSSLIAFIIFVFNEWIVELFTLDAIQGFLFLIPLAILFAGILQVTEQWLIRKKQFKISAKSTFLQALISQGSIVSLGFVYPFATVLIIVQSLREGLKALLMLFFVKRLGNEEQIYKENKLKQSEKSLKLFRKYYEFPLYRAPEVFLNGLSQGLPILMLTSFFGPVAAGFYTISKTVLSIPTQLIGKSVGDVFYPRIAEAANNNENLTNIIKKTTISLAIIGLVPYSFVIIFGPWLFGIVFGPDWINAGEYARWIALWSFFAFINQPSVKSLPVLSAQAFQLGYTIFMLITRLFMLGIGYFVFLSDKIAIALFGLSGAFLNLGLILITVIISKNYDKRQNSN